VKGQSLTPAQVSSETGAATVCDTDPDSDLMNVDNSIYFYKLPGTDGNCNTSDDVEKMVTVGMSSSTSPVTITPKKAIFNDENKQIEKIKNEFDTNGLLIKSFEFEGDNLAFELNYEYDANSNISKITKYNNKKVIIESVSREYDEQNRLVLQKYGRQFVVKTSYNDELRTKTEERTDAQGNIQYKMETHYDENGNILEEKTPLSTTIYEYEFF